MRHYTICIIGLGRIGGDFSQALSGNEGNDTLNGGLDNDTMTGGAGMDRFVFDNLTSVDVINDFIVCEDLIVLDALAGGVFVFSNVHNSVFDEENFRIINGLTADPAPDGSLDDPLGERNDFIVYDDLTGNLYYDSDGDGDISNAIQFADLGSGLKLLGLSAANFDFV